MLVAAAAAALCSCQGGRARNAGPPSPAVVGDAGADDSAGSGEVVTDAGGDRAIGPADVDGGRGPEAASDAGPATTAGGPDSSTDAGIPDATGAEPHGAGPDAGAADAVSSGSGSGSGGAGGSGGSGSGGVAGVGGIPGAAGAGPPPPPADPLCAIDLSCAAPIVDDPKVTCTLAIAGGDGRVIFSDHAGVELRGRTSLFFPKKNYAIELRDAAGGDADTDLLNMGPDADWVLDGSWVDRSFVRGALIFDSFRALGAGRWAPEGRFCTLNLDGQPQGIYRLVEKIERGPSRLDIAADDGTGTSFVVKQDEQGVLDLDIGIDSRWKLVDPDQDKATDAQRAGVQAWLNGLDAALDSGTPADPTTGVLAYLDLESTVDWVLIEELSKNVDAYNLSLYFVRDRGGTARLVPWDLDLSLGQPTVTGELPGTEHNDQPDGWIVHRSRLIQVLGRVPALTSRLGPRWRALRATGGPLSDAALAARLDAYARVLTPAALTQNFHIWPLADVEYSSFYMPYTLYPVASYDDEVARLRAFVAARLAWIDAHIDAYPN
ncbi:MAG TPA: CotH kinase family protein [Polyangia bacterium]|nr:CotH kinase family protein [Polyangia bacterium]